jgi:Coenzyme PQQ synthesis protein D (PqqD)
VKGRRIPDPLANISHEVSPHACTSWHIPQARSYRKAHALYTVSAGVRSARNEDGGTVLDIDQGQMFRLNPVGALILESLGRGCAEIEIAREISRRYSVGEATAAADLREFITSLEEHKLVRRAPEDKVS